MFTPATMKTFQLVSLKKYKDIILTLLQEEGCVELETVDCSASEHIALTPPSEDLKNANSLIMQTSRLLDSLYRHQNESTSILTDLLGKHIQSRSFNIEGNIIDVSKKYVNDVEKKVKTLISEEKSVKNKIKDIKRISLEREHLEKINVSLYQLGSFHFSDIQAGYVNSDDFPAVSQHIMSIDEESILLSHAIDETSTIICIVSKKEFSDSILKILKKFNTKIIEAPEEKIDNIEDEKETLLNQQAELNEKLSAVALESISDLECYKELLVIERDRLESGRKLGESKEAFLLTGWIPHKATKHIMSKLDEATGHHTHIDIAEPEDPKKVPILLSNNSFVRSYEMFTTSYSPPRYDHIDPTFYFAIFYAAFVGFMLTDVAYGAGLFFLGFFLHKKTPQYNLAMKDFSKIIMLSGFWAIFFGVLLGSFFGDLFACKNGVPAYGIPLPGITCITPILFDPLDKAIVLLTSSIFFGIFHINLGFITGVLNALKSGEYEEAIKAQISFMLLEFGVFCIIVDFALKKNLFNKFVTEIIRIFSPLFVTALSNFVDLGIELFAHIILPIFVCVGLCTFLASVFSFVGYKSNVYFGMLLGLICVAVFVNSVPMFALDLGGAGVFVAFIGIYLFLFYEGMTKITDIPGFMGVILSYARLFALALATSGIAMALNLISVNVILQPMSQKGQAWFALGAIIFMVLQLVGQVANFFQNLLGAFTHSLRLFYVEFFGVFYEGGGSLFTPLSMERIYTRR